MGVHLTHFHADFAAGHMDMAKAAGCPLSAAALASMAYDTWTNKLAKVPEFAKIFPARGAGSLCGTHLSDQPTSTIGGERRSNPCFRYTNRAGFIRAVLGGLPEAPQYFEHDTAMNSWVSFHPSLWAGHIPGAVNQPFTADVSKKDGIALFKPTDELAAACAGIIPSWEAAVIVHCRTGHQAGQTFFVLKHFLGYLKVLCHDAGWTKWAARPELPFETEASSSP
jgi:rhodanese-related sulfurtransferase